MTDYRKHMADACTGALLSNDTSTQNGAILLSASGLPIAVGWNSIPRKLFKEERLERPIKYTYTVHAEARAVIQAGRSGSGTEGTTLVCPWAACEACALTMIEAGVSKLVRLKDRSEHGQWKNSVAIGDSMFEEAGLEVIEIDGGFNGYPILRNGELWLP
jgi:dCMP deaminase